MKLNYYQLYWYRNGLNAVRIFAALNKTDEIATSLQYGASIIDTVYGYALGGHIEQVDAILGANAALINTAAIGYARANNVVAIAKLNNQYEPIIKTSLFKGYAQAANITQIYTATQCKHNAEYIASIVEGLAECGHADLVQQYAISTSLQNIAITAAAHAGNVKLVSDLLGLQNIILSNLTLPLNSSTSIALGHALIGYSKGRHYEYLESLLTFNLNPALCLTAITGKNGIDSQ